jgi:hypothetical protein
VSEYFRAEIMRVILDEEGYEESLEKDREIHGSGEDFGILALCSLYPDGRFGYDLVGKSIRYTYLKHFGLVSLCMLHCAAMCS